MKWNVVFGMVVAAGSLAATGVRAQENAAGKGATTTEAQTAKSAPAASGTRDEEPGTVDATGVVVPKPNPMSDFLKRAREFGPTPVELQLLDDRRTDAASDGHTK